MSIKVCDFLGLAFRSSAYRLNYRATMTTSRCVFPPYVLCVTALRQAGKQAVRLSCGKLGGKS